MAVHDEYTRKILAENEELKQQLEEANDIINAIRHGSVDALVLSKDGQPHLFSIESADYTYRILIEKFGEGALSISKDGIILYCNDYFSKLIGIPASQITGSYFRDYTDSPKKLQSLMGNLKNGPAKSELLLKSKDRNIPAYVSMSDLSPNVSAIGLVVTDLTEKRTNEEALKTYQAELERKIAELNLTNTNLGQFIHVVSHDLKEPIRKLLTYTSFLTDQENSSLSGPEKNSVRIINTSAVRLNSLVDDLVKYSYSAVKEKTHNISLNKIFKEVVDDLELVITENSAVIESVNLPIIHGSKVQMRQLFSNLLANAIKYRKADVTPKIQVTCALVEPDGEEQKYYKITFSDNGIGMPESHLSKIFTIFQRLHMRNEYSGNGIGLAICKKIMDNHSGKIEVESIEGEGSRFHLYFPDGK
jgi:PAS domain S-box-containing protein